MTKKELAVRISYETGIPYEDVLAVIQKTLDGITDALVSGDRVEFRNFGVFETAIRGPRTGRNPGVPGNTVKIPRRRAVKFKPGKSMKERVAASKASGSTNAE